MSSSCVTCTNKTLPLFSSPLNPFKHGEQVANRVARNTSSSPPLRSRGGTQNTLVWLNRVLILPGYMTPHYKSQIFQPDNTINAPTRLRGGSFVFLISIPSRRRLSLIISRSTAPAYLQTNRFIHWFKNK